MEASFLFIFLASITSAAPLTKTIDCPSGWVNAHEDGCFKFLGNETSSTWFEAMLACEKEGGYLAEPKTLRQMEFLTGLVELEAEFYGPREWWLGRSDTGHEGTWVWTHSYQETSETFWVSGSPSYQAGNDLDCAITLLDGELVWDDISCQAKKNNISPLCQRDMENTLTSTADPTTSAGWDTTTNNWDTTGPWNPETTTRPWGTTGPWDPKTTTETGPTGPWNPKTTTRPWGTTGPWNPKTTTRPWGTTGPWNPKTTTPW